MYSRKGFFELGLLLGLLLLRGTVVANAQTVAIDARSVRLTDNGKTIRGTATIGRPSVLLNEIRITHPPKIMRAYTVFSEKKSKWLVIEDPHEPMGGGAHYPIKAHLAKGKPGTYEDDLIVDVLDPNWESVGKVRIHVIVKFVAAKVKTTGAKHRSGRKK
jgi:hypothetical protein